MDRWVMIITNGRILWIVLAQTASLSAQRVTIMEKMSHNDQYDFIIM